MSRNSRAHVDTKKKESTSAPEGHRRRYTVLSFRSSTIHIFFINIGVGGDRGGQRPRRCLRQRLDHAHEAGGARVSILLKVMQKTTAATWMAVGTMRICTMRGGHRHRRRGTSKATQRRATVGAVWALIGESVEKEIRSKPRRKSGGGEGERRGRRSQATVRGTRESSQRASHGDYRNICPIGGVCGVVGWEK